jgi:hypothetical protein
MNSQIKEHEYKYIYMNINSCIRVPSSISRRAFILASELSTHTMCVFGSIEKKEKYLLSKYYQIT